MNTELKLGAARRALLCGTAVAFVLGPLPALATDFTWTGATATYETAANWGGAGFPQASTDTGSFGAAGNTTPTISTVVSPGSLTFLSNAQSYTLTIAAGALNLSGGGLIDHASVTETVSGPITGSAPITVDGGGQLTLSQASAGYSGIATVTSGTLYISNNNSLGTGSVVLNGGTVTLGVATTIANNISVNTTGGTIIGAGGNPVYSGVISNGNGTTGTVTFSGGNQPNLTAVNTYTGATIVTSGTKLVLNGAGSIAASSSVTLNGNNGFLDISPLTATSTAIQSLSGGGIVSLGGKTLTITNGSGTFTGALQDGGNSGGTGGKLTITGGTETLTPTNPIVNDTFTGGVTITGGTLVAGNAGAFNNTTVTLNGGTLAAGGSAVTLTDAVALNSTGGSLNGGAGGLTLSGVIANGSGTPAGTLNISGGTVTLGAANSYTGVTGIASGATLALTGTGAIATSSGVANNGTLDVSGVTAAGASIKALTGSGSVALGAKTFSITAAAGTFSGVIADGGAGGSVLIAGGSQIFSGNNTYAGGTTIVTGASLQIGAGGTTGAAGTGTIANSGTLVFNRSDTVIFSGTVTGTGAFTQAGSGTLTVTGSIAAGPITINSGSTLQFGNGGTAGSYGASSIADNGTLAFNYGTNNATVNGVIAGTGGLTQNGSGTLTLTGTSTYSGVTNPNGGTVALSATGSIAASSVFITTGAFDISATTAGASIVSLGGPSGNVALGSKTLTLTNASGTYAGTISGTGGLVISGSEILTGANSYSGGTTINSGATLQLGTTPSAGFFGSAGTGAITDNGTLSIVAGSGNATIANVISGTGNVVLNVLNGTATLSAANTYSGTSTITSGTTLNLTGSIANSSVVDNGALALGSNGATLTSLSGGGSLALAGPLTLSNASGTFSGLFSGTGILTIAAGTEIITTNPACGCSANVTIASGATLQSNGVPLTIIDNGAYILALPANTSLLYSSAISGSGSVTLNAPGSTLSLLTAETYTGLTTITAGTLALSSAGSIATSSGLADNGTFDISGTQSGASIKALSGAGNVVLGARTLTITAATGSFTGVISGTGGIATSGSQTLGGVNTYTGGTTITSGTLALSGAGSIAASSGVSDGGTFDISGTTSGATVANIAGAGGVTLGAKTLTIAAASGTLSGAIAGTGGVAIASGTQVLSGANSYTGGTSIAGGAGLQIGAGGTAGSLAGNVADNGALTFNRSDTLTYGGVISGTGTLTKAGSGTLILNGVNTYTGATLVSAGTLEIGDGNNLTASIASPVTVASGGTLAGHGTVNGAVTVQSGGTLQPGGSVGTLAINGNLSLPAGTTLTDEVSPTVGSKVAVSGTATLGGTLAIVADPGTYVAGTDYKVLTAATVSGTFSSITGSVPGQTGTLQYSATGVDFIIGATTTPPPATGGTTPVTTTFLFNSYAKTPNGVAAGAALTAGASTGALYLATGKLVSTNAAAVPGALAQMAGDIHASIRGAAVEDSRIIRDAVINHIVRGSDDRIVWGTVFGGYGQISTIGNAAGLHHDSEGFVVGADALVMDNLRVGVAGGFTANRARTADNGSSEHGEMGHIIAYADWTRDALDLKLGGDAGIGNAHVYRSITALSANEADRQSQQTAQIFGEAGYKLETDQAMVEPYVRIADIAANTGSFAETGGVAALSGGSKTDNQAYAMLGLRAFLGTYDVGGISITPRDDFGWQHALNRFAPGQTLAFQSSATSFTVQGVPLGTDAGTAQIGVDVAIAPGAVLTVGYDGSFSHRVQNNAANVALNWKF